MQDEYVERGSPQDEFPDGKAKLVGCKYCGTPLLLKPDEDPDCGMHGN